MKKKGINKLLSLALISVFIFSGFINPGTVKADNSRETTLLREGFDHGISAPEGWTFEGINSIYTDDDKSGIKSPSLKFDFTGDSITTPVFSNPSQLTFWIRGMSSQSESASLIILVCKGGQWGPLDYINPITASESVKTYALNSGVTQIKFMHAGSQGEFALDDVVVTGRITDENPSTGISNISYIRTDSNNDGAPDYINRSFTVQGRVTALLGAIPDFPYQENYASEGSNTNRIIESNQRYYTTIYIQDETGGIALTGLFTKDLSLGMTVKASGKLYQSEGEERLAVENENTNISIIDTNSKAVEPKTVKTSESMSEANEGLLVRVAGKVSEIIPNGLKVNDGSGTARVLIDSFRIENVNYSTLQIPSIYTPSVSVGDTVTVTGIVSEDNAGYKIRIRNTSEIVKGTVSNTPGNTQRTSSAKLNKTNVVINQGKFAYVNIITTPGNAVVARMKPIAKFGVTILQDKKNPRLLKVTAGRTASGIHTFDIPVTVNGKSTTLKLTVNVKPVKAKTTKVKK